MRADRKSGYDLAGDRRAPFGSTAICSSVTTLSRRLYAGAVVVRPERNYLRLGLDSIIVLVLCAIGIAGLLLVAH
jgi:hypothetical protein